MLSEQYETSFLFYVTLSFLCNIICYLISVFVFSLVTLSGATTYWRQGTRTKKGTLQQAKGVNRTTYWRRYIATTKWFSYFSLFPPLQREKFNSALTVLCYTKKHTHAHSNYSWFFGDIYWRKKIPPLQRKKKRLFE